MTENPVPLAGGNGAWSEEASPQHTAPPLDRQADLAAEFRAAADRTREPHLRWLRAKGVAGTALVRSGLIGIGRGRISDGLYDPQQDAPEVFILRVVERSELVDLVAFLPRAPHLFGRRRGLGWCLGHAAVVQADWLDEPLVLHADPLDWLTGGAEGAVVLDWRAAAVRLCGLQRFHCSTAALADRLDKALTPPRVHRIMVPQ